MANSLRNIAVIGAGLMGHGIALSFAKAGFETRVHDPHAETLETLIARVTDSLIALGVAAGDTAGITARITPCQSLDAAVSNADLVVEAAPEKLALKQEIFAQIEPAVPAQCLLASNTSVIPITSIMQGLADRSRGLGTHWWNPPHMIPLVEVIRTEWTTDQAMDQMVGILTQIGKTPVRVEKDVAGFIGNRLQHALWREAISLVEKGVCSAEAVDEVIKASFGRRLAVLGPLENADLVGTDLTLDIHQNVLADLEASGAPSPLLESLVAEGKLGMKSGEGFRKWTPEAAAATRRRVTTHLQKLDTILE
uniref:3-hydroxyacyl-CoA dehydrogenase family protein n=1 Tax=Pararhizobium sp. IMCC3301 TaxID=3067904 RepID=UPI0027405614|nr:3-hydroxyacyl-CoA dehydrogenase NAD-binding domain-containing protein [Pararhizobium sp. IMCC3301]